MHENKEKVFFSKTKDKKKKRVNEGFVSVMN